MRAKSTAHYAVTALVSAVLLCVANLYEAWLPLTRGVVTHDFPALLWALNLALAVQLVGNLVLARFRPERLTLWVDWAVALCNLVSAVMVVRVFPFELSRVGGPWLDFAARVLAMVGVAVQAISFGVATVKALLGPKPKPGHLGRQLR
jgi:hypothetical protein